VSDVTTPVIPAADALAEASRDLQQVPDSLDCVSASGMTGGGVRFLRKRIEAPC